MNEIEKRIAAVVGEAHPDLVTYYEKGEFLRYEDSFINCLSLENAENYSQDLSYIPIANSLGLWVVDDAENSNPFCFISKGPCAGAILHFCHDDDQRIAFSSLEKLLLAMKHIGVNKLDIEGMEFERDLLFPLNKEVCSLLDDGSDDAHSLVYVYLAACNDIDDKLAERILENDDFFVREVFAGYLKLYPSIEFKMYAEKLALDTVAQVARPAKEALKEIEKITSRG